MATTSFHMQVYKFLSAKFALEDLRKRRLKISTFSDMNDPFELQGVVPSNPHVHHLLTSHALSHHGALCFSRNWSNPILWSHYADKHKGVCLGFEISATVKLYKPCYVESPPIFNSNVLVNAARRGQNLRESDPEFQKSKKVIAKMYLTKFKGWSYEDEVRILIQLKEDQKVCGFYFAEFDENIQPNVVIAGPRCSDSALKSDIEVAAREYSPPSRSFRLCFHLFRLK